MPLLYILQQYCTTCSYSSAIPVLYSVPLCSSYYRFDCLQVDAIRQGQSWGIIQSLVSCDFSRTHFLDRFCTSCRRAFSSDYCPDHAHHHPGEDFHLLSIVREDGWVLIPEEQLPAVLVSGVKVGSSIRIRTCLCFPTFLI